MAGRPKTTARKLAELEERAFQLHADVCNLRPGQYAEREGQEGLDEYAAAWNESCEATKAASNTVNLLLGLAEERAGLDWDTLDIERDRRRGLLPEEEAETATT